MSRFYNKKSTTPFCSFCRDAGKPRNVYTSHYPKDRPGKDGKVVCPTILSTTCGYCRESGHTTKYCSVLKHRNQEYNPSQYRNERHRKPRMISTNNDGWRSIPTKKHSNSPSYSRKASPVQKPKPKHNKFAVLSYDEEIDTSLTTTATTTRQEDFPSLSNNQGPKVTKSKPVLKGAWEKGISSVVKEEKVFESQPVVKKKDEFSSMASLGMDLNAIVKDAKAYREALTIKSPISTEWADIEDSDDSDYDSEESYYSDGY